MTANQTGDRCHPRKGDKAMPNRIIKESICASDTVDQLTWFEEVFFYRLIVNCDDYGRFDARLPIIKARLFPLKSVTDKQISDALNKLSTVGIVTVYEYDGRPYLQLVTWEKHQQIRAKKSKYPAFDETCKHLISDDIKCPRNPIQSESESNNNIYTQTDQEIIDFWNSKNIIQHGESQEIKKALKSCKLKKDEILQAIENYSKVYHDEDYFYNHKWRLDKFLNQKNGARDFLSDGQQWIAYKDRKKKSPHKNPAPQAQNFKQREYSAEFYKKVIGGIQNAK